MELGLRSTVAYMEITNFEMILRSDFFVGNEPRIQQLKTKLVECKQQRMTIVNYYGKLKTIWEELRNYEHNLVCKHGGCKCNIGRELDKKCEEERLHQFLVGLDDSVYGIVRSNILSTKSLPSLNRVYAMMVVGCISIRASARVEQVIKWTKKFGMSNP